MGILLGFAFLANMLGALLLLPALALLSESIAPRRR
jgi:4-amino-4-deoxy-L-arabinose transferase-like glycosyltransferase